MRGINYAFYGYVSPWKTSRGMWIDQPQLCYDSYMKITKTNNDELVLARGGYLVLIVGFVMIIGGLAGLFFGLHATGQGGLIGRIAGAAAALGGVFAILLASKREVFLRRGGTSEVRTTNILFHKMKSVSFATDQIVAVGFETHDEYSGVNGNNSGEQTRTRESSLWLILQDTTEIPLFSVTKAANSGVSVGGISLNGLGKAPLYTEATAIADFVGLPLQSRAATQSLPANLGIFADSARRMMESSSAPATPSAGSMPTGLPTQHAMPPAIPVLSVQPNPVVEEPVAPVVPVVPMTTPTVSTPSERLVAPVVPERGGIQIPPR